MIATVIKVIALAKRKNTDDSNNVKNELNFR
jgi:hypothetical protein